jgi:branched-chain amino acid transport system substrate-binding protein
MRRKKLLGVCGSVFLLLALVTVPFLTACPAPPEETTAPTTLPPDEETTTPPPAEPIKIGASLDLTGFVMDFGVGGRNAYNFALDEVGWEVAGRPVELIIEDAAGTAEQALDGVRKMIDVDNVDVILAPVLASQWDVLVPYIHEEDVLMLGPWSRHNFQAWEKPSLNITTAGTGTQTTYPNGIYAAQELGYETVTTIAYDVQSGYAMVTGFNKGFTEAGGTVLKCQWLPFGILDFGPFFTQMAEADALLLELWGQEQLSATQQFHEFGYDKKMGLIYAQIHNIRYHYLKDMGDWMVGAHGASSYQFTIDTPANKDFVDAWEAKYGQKPDEIDYEAYATIKVYLDAVEATGGDTTSTVVRDAIIGNSFDLPGGTWTYVPEGYPIKPTYIVEAQKKEGELLWETVKKYPDIEDQGFFLKEDAESYVKS